MQVPRHTTKISVLMEPEDARRFDAYCSEKGFKKSSLAARLIREHLNREGFEIQRNLFGNETGARANGS